MQHLHGRRISYFNVEHIQALTRNLVQNETPCQYGGSSEFHQIPEQDEEISSRKSSEPSPKESHYFKDKKANTRLSLFKLNSGSQMRLPAIENSSISSQMKLFDQNNDKDKRNPNKKEMSDTLMYFETLEKNKSRKDLEHE